MPRKSITLELEQILHSLPNMNSEELELTLERLRTVGVESPSGPTRRPGVSCPFTQMQVISPCNLKECKFHIENEWSRNCLLEYIDQQNCESLAVEEIAFLYDTTVEEVSNSIERAMVELRENPEETLGIEGDLPKLSIKQIKINFDDVEGTKITQNTISPSFMEPINRVLEMAASDEEIFEHSAVQVLGILDSIINELE